MRDWNGTIVARSTPLGHGAVGIVRLSGADAVVIGSALVDTLSGAEDTTDAVRRAEAFLGPIRAALDAVPAGHAA